MYYCALTGQYIGIYTKTVMGTDLQEINLAAFEMPALLSDDKFYSADFSIKNYLKKKRKKEIVLTLYKEPNYENAEKFLWGYDVRVLSEKENCKTISFKAESADAAITFVLSCGKSVIVESPPELRNDIINILKRTAENYKN